MEKVRNLLGVMDEISSQMQEIIFVNYFDSKGVEGKYLFSLYSDCFKTSQLFCISLSKVGISQAGLLLRLLLEQVSIVEILTKESSLIKDFVGHYKFRKEIILKDKDEQKELISKNITWIQDMLSPFWIMDGLKRILMNQP